MPIQKLGSLFNSRLNSAVYLSFQNIPDSMGTCFSGSKSATSLKLMAFEETQNQLIRYDPSSQKWTMLSLFYDDYNKFEVQYRRHCVFAESKMLVAGGIVNQDFSNETFLDSEAMGFDKNHQFASNRVYLFDISIPSSSTIYTEDKGNSKIPNLITRRHQHALFSSASGFIVAGFGLGPRMENCYSLEIFKFSDMVEELKPEKSEQEEYSKQEGKKVDVMRDWWLVPLPPELQVMFKDTRNPLAVDIQSETGSRIGFLFIGDLIRANEGDKVTLLTMEMGIGPVHFSSTEITMETKIPPLFSAFGLVQESQYSLLLFALEENSSEIFCYVVSLLFKKISLVSRKKFDMGPKETGENLFVNSPYLSLALKDEDHLLILVSCMCVLSFERSTRSFEYEYNFRQNIKAY